MKRARILVVEDDADTRALLRRLCERAGYEVVDAGDGREGLRAFYASRPDLVLLDLTMPGLDGWQTLERIRDLSTVPVIMLTARESELEKVRALKGGADDYVTKPFGRQELVARIEAHLRRHGGQDEPQADVYEDGHVMIDFASRSVRVDGRAVSLTPLEFRLLATLVGHPNQVLGRDQLRTLVWGDTSGVSPGQVKLYVGYLRRKLGDRVPIETVRGFGYRYRRG